MIVTKFKYPLEKNLLPKLDLMAQRCSGKGSKKDVVLLCEGGEGEGKTTLSVAIAYYISEKTGRKFGEQNVFFDLNKLLKFAQETEEQIIIWDEPALQALSTDWASKIVKNLTRFLMMARKKRHFIIINMTKFYKFNEYIVVDRAIGLIHVYSRKNIQSGRFMYIKKKYLESLWRDYRFSKRRNYAKYCSKRIRGMFPDVLNPKYKNNVLSEFDDAHYESEKDKAINSIGMEERVTPAQLRKQLIIKFIKRELTIGSKLTQKQLAEKYEVAVRTIQKYAKEIKDSALRQEA